MKRIFGFLLLSVFFFSCSDSIDSHGSNFLLTEKPYILKGSVKSSDKEELSGRMAIPATPDIAEYLTDSENYKFEVWHDGILQNGVTVAEGGNFSLQLKTGDNQIKIKVIKKINDTSSVCILESCENITIGANSPHVLSKNFVLKKLQTGSVEGSVSLNISLSSDIGYVTATLVETDQTKISNWQSALGITDGTLISELDVSGSTAKFPSSGDSLSINSGSYRVKFDFYDSKESKNILYSRIQTIEVYDGLLTNKWYEAGSQDGPVDNSGTFTVDQTAIQNFINTTVYVDPQNGSDTNGGTYYGKLKTLQKAVDTVVARNTIKSGTEEFNIYLCGDVTTEENVTLKSQKKITLNLKSDSSARRVISGSNQASKALFEIDGKSTTDTTVNFENIQIKGQNNSATGSNNEGKGGGIYVNNATLSLKNCSLDSNNANNGAGIYVDTNGIINIYENTSFTGNNATDSGGAIYNAGIVNMSAGTIGGNTTTSKNSAVNSGGAIQQGGTFKISGSAIVYAGSEKSNDVYIVTGKYITLPNNSFSGSATITPSAWNRGKQVLDGDYADDFVGKFSVTDSDWSVVADGSVGRIDTGTTIYVSNSGNDGTGRGTSSKPYATIQSAAKETWKAQAYTISVSGTLTAASADNLQSIPNDTSVKASSITLSGTNSATINANSKGSALTISKAVPVTITNIKITGGSATNGGGLYVGAGTVKLGAGAVITGNKASTYGGGAYVASGASLFMYGTSIVGDTITYTATNDTLTTTGTTGCANAAGTSGGGIYNLGNLYLGYTAEGVKATGTNAFSGGVRRNYAKATGSQGGGIYSTGTMYIASGNISYNRNENNGGGIYAAGTTNDINGAITMTSNHGTAGGGAITVASSKQLTISGAASFTSNTSNNGGAIINNGTLKITANATFKKNAGTNAGGAIYNAGVLTMSSGTIGTSGNLNTAGSGGGVYHAGTSFSISSSASVYAGSGASGSNDVYVVSGKTISPDNSWSGSLTMTPGDYVDTTTYIGGSYVSKHYAKISVTPQSSAKWITTSGGKIEKGVRVSPAEALTELATLPSGSTLAIAGATTEQNILDIGIEIDKRYQADNRVRFAIDLTGATGLTTIPTGQIKSDSSTPPRPNNSGFYWCNALTSIALPTTVKTLADNAFTYCYNLKTITGYEGLESLGKGAFSACQVLESFDLTKTKVTGALPENLFMRCNALTEITIPKGITSLGTACFSSCTGLRSVTFEAGSQISEIPNTLFSGCSALTTINNMPSTITKIGDWAFGNTNSLTTLTIPANVTSLGYLMFNGCDAASKTIKYKGSSTQWAAIIKDEKWDHKSNSITTSTVKEVKYNQ